MISGLVLNHLKGLGRVMRRRYRAPCPTSSEVLVTVPAGRLTLDSGHALLQLFAQALDSEPHCLPGLEVDRRLLPIPYARWCSSRNDVAGLKAHELRDVGNELGHPENHRRGASILVAVPVDLK